MALLEKIDSLRRSSVRRTIEARLAQFASFASKRDDEWFSELCFCLLTANARADSALRIQEDLGAAGFAVAPRSRVLSTIKRHRHRFHNTKTEYIVRARKFRHMRALLVSSGKKSREWLVQNIKGFGMKESSHFLRNVGYQDVAILDRHIINSLAEFGIIRKPGLLTPKRYVYIEQKFARLAKQAGMTLPELDLYLWYLKTGVVLK